MNYRFLYEVLNYDARRNHTKKYYNAFRFIVTLGSIFLPAILSIGQMDPAKLPKNFDRFSYWASWSISLTVTACNGFLQLFSLDKNYFEYAITSEQLKTEGWQYFQLSGKYEDYPDHSSAYRSFCKSIENIKRKQVEKEFSGKAEVKKKKEFDFKKELEKVVPERYAIEGSKNAKEVDTKVAELDTLMKDKMGKLDTLMGILEKKDIYKKCHHKKKLQNWKAFFYCHFNYVCLCCKLVISAHCYCQSRNRSLIFFFYKISKWINHFNNFSFFSFWSSSYHIY